MKNIIDRLTERVESHIQIGDDLCEFDIWSNHKAIIWQANRFIGRPTFYPVYKFKNLFSHSILSLILKKRKLNLNHDVIQQAKQPGFLCLSGLDTIDRDITRIGGPHRCGFEIQDVNEYASLIAGALVDDVATTERKNPENINIVLCGGKDSLNLLLLPWQGKTIALSAEPNFPYVRQFVDNNRLNCAVMLLEDIKDETVLVHEVLEGCCRIQLEHWRWGAHLRAIARAHDGKVTFWKGQMADAYTSERWKTYIHPIRPLGESVLKVYKKARPFLPGPINRFIGHQLQPSVVQTCWDRGAVMQGCHVAFVREIADCLTLSAYHGPAMTKIWDQADLVSVANRDMRHLIGAILHGRQVIYPQPNPSPPASKFRIGLSDPNKFIVTLEKAGIEIVNIQPTT